RMLLGTWRETDSEGSVDIVYDGNGTFQTYRYYQMLQNFQYVFVPTPISTGTWQVSNGRLVAHVTSSSRVNMAGQTFSPAIRSISGTDLILVDNFGRVTRAVRVR
ncbi:MAG: TIGR03067 domain-containing protein, partial [Pirellulales bacterium]|nr:TIGR03067 domain-containing protein [Pirellulales bacterium]